MKTVRCLFLVLLLVGAVLLLSACDISAITSRIPFFTTAATTAEAPVTTAPVTTTEAAAVTTAEAVTTEPPATTAAPVTTAPPVTTLDTLTALSPYLTLSREEYYGLSVEIPGKGTVSDTEVSQYIDGLLAKAATYKEFYEGELREGDAVHIFYRGEILEDGKWVEFVGGSNQATANAQRLVLGSGAFIPGFEEGLIGLSLDDTALSLSTDLSRVIGVNGITVAYVRYQVSYGGIARGSFSDRIDLLAESGRYVGSSLLSDLEGRCVGEVLPGPYTVSFDITGDLVPEELTLTDVEITYAVVEERSFCLPVTFSESYSIAELAGREARFHVIVMKAERTETPALSYDLIVGTFGVALEDLAPFVPTDGALSAEEQIVAAFPHFIRAMLEEERDAEIYAAVIEAFWERMNAIVPKAYPEPLLEEMIADVRAQLEVEYEDYLWNYGGDLSLEEFVLAYYAIPDGVTDLEGFLRHYGEFYAKQEMILYYIAAAEGWELTATERIEEYTAYMQMLLDYYNSIYGGSITIEMLENADYTEEYVLEQVLYEKVCDAIFESMREHIVFEDE